MVGKDGSSCIGKGGANSPSSFSLSTGRTASLGTGIVEIKGPSNLGLSVHCNSLQTPDITAATTLDDGGASAPFVFSTVSSECSRRRRCAHNDRRRLGMSVEETSGEEWMSG